MYALRPYQEEARDAILREWGGEHTRTLLVLPTGCGKTIVFASVIQKVIEEGGRVLVLAHRKELLQQASEKILHMLGEKEAKKDSGTTEEPEDDAGGEIRGSERVVIASIQGMSRPQRLKSYPPDYFTAIVVDEAHHCLSESYRCVLDYFESARVLGVTATPDRGDKRGLGEYFESIAYEYRMADAVRDGYLCPVIAKLIPVKPDLTQVHTTRGDYDSAELGKAISPFLAEIADAMVPYCLGRKTVVFLPLIHTAEEFCQLLNERGLRAREVHGTSSDRGEILESFRVGEFDVLCNAMLLTEGWDCPSVDCIAVLRPTQIRSLYQQMVGRGMRLYPGKKELLLLDFLWLSKRHTLCRAASLVSPTPALEDKIQHYLEAGMSLTEAETRAEGDAVAEREATLARRIAANQNKQAQSIDPIFYATSIGAEDLVDYEPIFDWELQPPTEKQIALLTRNGMEIPSGMTKGYASHLIDHLMNRMQSGMSSPRQIRFLSQYGFEHVARWSFNQANFMIHMIRDNHWQLPGFIKPDRIHWGDTARNEKRPAHKAELSTEQRGEEHFDNR